MSARYLGLPVAKRAGYPLIMDSSHPLWELQCEGWRGYTPERCRVLAAYVDAGMKIIARRLARQAKKVA